MDFHLEFYLKFWDIIAKDILLVFKDVWETRDLA